MEETGLNLIYIRPYSTYHVFEFELNMAKRILFVCLGNICRSPAAEGVFLHLLKMKGLLDAFYVDSAGTGAWHVGKRADRRMRLAAKNRGFDLPSIARQITKDDLLSFDLIMTMDGDNFQDVKSLLLEANIESPVEIKPILQFARHHNIKDVPDPYYGGDDGFEEVLDLLEDACEGLLDSLTSED